MSLLAIEAYRKADKEVRKFLGIEGSYIDIDFQEDSTWSADDAEVCWGESDDQDPDTYASEIVERIKSSNTEVTTFLVSSDTGGGNYYMVFYNNKEIK